MRFSLLPFAIFITFAGAEGRPQQSPATEHLMSQPCLRATARYEVLQPNASEPVNYDIEIIRTTAPEDTLAGCRYLIDWTLHRPDGSNVHGFTAYYGGNMFSYSPGKLLEYHYESDSIPFISTGRIKGVQRRARFGELLPEAITAEIEAAATDSAVTTSTMRRGETVTTEYVTTAGGEEVQRRTFTTVDGFAWPAKEIETTYNPGGIAEQNVRVFFTSATADGDCSEINEIYLKQRYTDIFDRYRRDSFTLENLRGEALPGWAAPTLSRERSVRHSGDAMGRPVIVALLDADNDETAAVIETLRSAADMLPFTTGLIMVFADNDARDISPIVGAVRDGEAVLLSARSLLRDCGATDLPAFLFVRPDGTVADIQIGRNKDLRNIVIQKTAAAR